MMPLFRRSCKPVRARCRQPTGRPGFGPKPGDAAGRGQSAPPTAHETGHRHRPAGAQRHAHLPGSTATPGQSAAAPRAIAASQART